MPLNDAAKRLAVQKGFTLRMSGGLDHCQLIDEATQLPELNAKGDSLFFSLKEAMAFLGRLHDRRMVKKGG